MRLIDEQYTRTPFYGSRRMTVVLNGLGHEINRKRVQRLMRLMNLEGVAPGPRTSQAHPEHKVYPYLLRDLAIVRPNQVWASDITYIPMRMGFMYLVAILDWYSRYVVAWSLSNTLETAFCLDALSQALVQDLGPYQAAINGWRLVDFKVRITNGGTEAVTRVILDSEDDKGRRWSTVGVSTNVSDASYAALHDAITYELFADGAAAAG